MMSSRQRLLFIEITAVVAPMVLVYFGRGMLSSAGPVTTMNVNAPMLPPIPAATTKPLTPEQEKAADWVRQMPMVVDMRSPLNHPTDAPPPRPKPKTDDPKPTLDTPTRGLKLSAVLGNNGEQLASINGKIYAIGDMVRPGLKLIAIDPREYIITLEDENGQTFEIKREPK